MPFVRVVAEQELPKERKMFGRNRKTGKTQENAGPPAVREQSFRRKVWSLCEGKGPARQEVGHSDWQPQPGQWSFHLPSWLPHVILLKERILLLKGLVNNVPKATEANG